MKLAAIGVGAVVLVLALVAGGVALATRGDSANASEAVPTTGLPTSNGNGPTTAGRSKCADEETTEARDDSDPNGEDSPNAGDGKDDCGTAAGDERRDDDGGSAGDRADSGDDRAENGDDRAESGDDRDDSGDDGSGSGEP